ncbi:MAG: hypothetical protein FWF34_02810, partial [Alphaproteobacteria bacterium]|nr:hypothetical protein [Alphaproteobacteria bacterium]
TQIKTAKSGNAIVPSFSFAAGDGANARRKYFEIGDIKFDAYYDAAHKLIFVLDETHDAFLPNAMLVINPIGARKWDDILANDYDIDLETVRPKKNNKYQKLDIEYDGLSAYNVLINAYESNGDTDSAMDSMMDFRRGAAARLARVRRDLADKEIRTATATLRKTEAAIKKLDNEIESSEIKLKSLKSRVGKGPTKESAAKILRASARLDADKEKLKRAEVRLRRAKKRIADAKKEIKHTEKFITNYDETPEPKVAEMAEDIKPLFNKDPKIMDETIAFKPIEFDSMPQMQPPKSPEFSPPSFTPAPEPEIEPVSPSAPATPIAPVTNTSMPMETVGEPVAPMATSTYQPQPTVASAPIAPAGDIPSRPMTANAGPVVPVAQVRTNRPSPIYYVMLALLIALSILTLWLYQNNMQNENAPNLLSATRAATPTSQLASDNPNAYLPARAPAPMPASENPFLDFEEAEVITLPLANEPTPVVVEPEPARPLEFFDLPTEPEPTLPVAPALEFVDDFAAADVPFDFEEDEYVAPQNAPVHFGSEPVIPTPITEPTFVGDMEPEYQTQEYYYEEEPDYYDGDNMQGYTD